MGSEDRKPFLTSTTLDQAFLDECHDSLLNQIEMMLEVETPVDTIRVSDRNKYVGDAFYEARTVFPVITRSVGEFLNPSLEFSNLQVEINNADGKYNDVLPVGDDYDGWIGRQMTVKLGLRDVSSTYNTIFSGQITEEGGFSRTVKSIIFQARDDFDKLNVKFPNAVFKSSVFPNIEADKENIIIPIVYGDWTDNVEENLASVPATPVNGADPTVNGETSHLNNVQIVISENDNTDFDTSEVYCKRGDNICHFNSADIVSVSSNRTFEIKNYDGGGVSQFEDGTDYNFERGDQFFVKVKGIDLSGYDENIIWIARHILMTYGGMASGDFDTNWTTLRDKATPTESAISTFKARVWIQEQQSVIEFVLSLLEQVRVEMFISKDRKLKLLPLHFDAFVASPTYKLRNWDLEKDSFVPKLDERNQFNRAKGVFNYLPNRNDNYQETPIYRNEDAITQAGKEISKKIVFPNLKDMTVVSNQVKEIIKLTSSYLETLTMNLTWRSMLLDIGDFVNVNIDIEGISFSGVPALIREIGYDPQGMKIPVKMWSFQMTPFSGWNPGYDGIVGGSTATITQE